MTKIKTRFYTYNQNNSGGSFAFDAKAGISHYVIIEAIDAAHANRRAEEVGLYFNGVDNEYDCPCCGDRWYPADDDEGSAKPAIYGTIVNNKRPYCDPYGGAGWMTPNPEAFIHHIDGTIEPVMQEEKKTGKTNDN